MVHHSPQRSLGCAVRHIPGREDVTKISTLRRELEAPTECRETGPKTRFDLDGLRRPRSLWRGARRGQSPRTGRFTINSPKLPRRVAALPTQTGLSVGTARTEGGRRRRTGCLRPIPKLHQTLSQGPLSVSPLLHSRCGPSQSATLARLRCPAYLERERFAFTTATIGQDGGRCGRPVTLKRFVPFQIERFFYFRQHFAWSTVMILPQVHLRKPCYDFYFL